VAELAAACAEAAGTPRHPVERRRPPRPGEVGRNFASYDLAHQTLGFTPAVALADGLARTWAWYQEHVLGEA
jgi:UDP-glucose 4-epimerase